MGPKWQLAAVAACCRCQAKSRSKQVVTDFNNALPGGNNNHDRPSVYTRDPAKWCNPTWSFSVRRFPISSRASKYDQREGGDRLEPGPGDCNNSTYTDQQVAQLAKIPILIEFGDHIGAVPSWLSPVTARRVLISRIKEAGGNVRLYHLPELGIHGNSHMVI